MRHRRLRRAAGRAGREARLRRASQPDDGHRHLVLHRGRRRRAAQAHGHPRPRHGRRLRAAHPPHRQGAAAPVGADPGPGPRDHLRPDRRHELGIPPEDIEVVHGDTDNTPFGLGTYGSRSTPVSGAAAAVVARGSRTRRSIIAAAALECSPDDLEWEHGRWFVKGDPDQGKTIQEIACSPTGASSCPRASRATSTPASSTTRRTSPTRSAPTSASSTWTRAPGR
jgi:CO/xanthine dehydrogenase Mo-binding subunit